MTTYGCCFYLHDLNDVTEDTDPTRRLQLLHQRGHIALLSFDGGVCVGGGLPGGTDRTRVLVRSAQGSRAQYGHPNGKRPNRVCVRKRGGALAASRRRRRRPFSPEGIWSACGNSGGRRARGRRGPVGTRGVRTVGVAKFLGCEKTLVKNPSEGVGALQIPERGPRTGLSLLWFLDGTGQKKRRLPANRRS